MFVSAPPQVFQLLPRIFRRMQIRAHRGLFWFLCLSVCLSGSRMPWDSLIHPEQNQTSFHCFSLEHADVTLSFSSQCCCLFLNLLKLQLEPQEPLIKNSRTVSKWSNFDPTSLFPAWRFHNFPGLWVYFLLCRSKLPPSELKRFLYLCELGISPHVSSFHPRSTPRSSPVLTCEPGWVTGLVWRERARAEKVDKVWKEGNLGFVLPFHSSFPGSCFRSLPLFGLQLICFLFVWISDSAQRPKKKRRDTTKNKKASCHQIWRWRVKTHRVHISASPSTLEPQIKNPGDDSANRCTPVPPPDVT